MTDGFPSNAARALGDYTSAAIVDVLPEDHTRACLVGRVAIDGHPYVVAARDNGLCDLSALAATSADLFDLEDAVARIRESELPTLCDLGKLQDGSPTLLSPCDLQAIKACGVTFVASMIERIIEERALGDPREATRLRADLTRALDLDLATIAPGSAEAEIAKQMLIEAGVWSQYLEVGIGPYAEIFTKAQPMSSVGHGAAVGIHPESRWNNPEPEIVLVVNSAGRVVGATLGNDVNMRDFEGRSALLLGKAKDNNASCAMGAFIRLFDDDFSLDDVRSATINLRIEGRDGFCLEDSCSMTMISRDPLELLRQTMGPHHQYPDGLMLFCGTMFAPTADRNGDGNGFTHKEGDVVTVSSAKLGRLRNVVTNCDRAPPWTFGVRSLMASLASRGLLRS